MEGGVGGWKWRQKWVKRQSYFFMHFLENKQDYSKNPDCGTDTDVDVPWQFSYTKAPENQCSPPLCIWNVASRPSSVSAKFRDRHISLIEPLWKCLRVKGDSPHCRSLPCFSDERNGGSGKRTKVTVEVKSLSGCSKPQKSYCIPFVLCFWPVIYYTSAYHTSNSTHLDTITWSSNINIYYESNYLSSVNGHLPSVYQPTYLHINSYLSC